MDLPSTFWVPAQAIVLPCRPLCCFRYQYTFIWSTKLGKITQHFLFYYLVFSSADYDQHESFFTWTSSLLQKYLFLYSPETVDQVLLCSLYILVFLLLFWLFKLAELTSEVRWHELKLYGFIRFRSSKGLMIVWFIPSFLEDLFRLMSARITTSHSLYIMVSLILQGL